MNLMLKLTIILSVDNLFQHLDIHIAFERAMAHSTLILPMRNNNGYA